MEMLRRAGDSPLYIDFYCVDRIPDRHREQGTAALRMVLDVLDRIGFCRLQEVGRVVWRRLDA
jgi:hypothetical protein